MYHSTSLFFLLTLVSSFNLDYNLLKTGPQFLNFCAEWQGQHSTSFQFIAISMQKGFTVKNGFTFKSVHTNAILFKLVSKQCFWLKDFRFPICVSNSIRSNILIKNFPSGCLHSAFSWEIQHKYFIIAIESLSHINYSSQSQIFCGS